MSNGRYDVAVIGGGNAGLAAALTARRLGARVVVLEGAPRALRGGNSRHTRNLRCATRYRAGCAFCSPELVVIRLVIPTSMPTS